MLCCKYLELRMATRTMINAKSEWIEHLLERYIHQEEPFVVEIKYEKFGAHNISVLALATNADDVILNPSNPIKSVKVPLRHHFH